MTIDTDIKKIFLLGLFLRFLFMPFAGFLQDIGNINYISHIFATGHFDIYRYISDRLTKGPLVTAVPIYTLMDLWAYFPLSYIILGAFNWVATLFLPELNWEKWFESDYAYRAMFLAKIPYLVFDIATGWLLYRYFKGRDTTSSTREEWAPLAFKLWWLNPVVIFTSYIFGHFDVMIAFFAFFAVFTATRHKRFYSGALLLGLGGLIKSVSMFILPFLAFSPEVKGWKKIATFMIGVGVLILGILPFVSYEPFRSQILFTPHIERMFALNFTPWGSRDTTLIFVVLYALLFFWYTASGEAKKMSLIEVSFILFAMTFVIINFHPQYFIWFIPFAIIVVIERGYTHILKYLYLFFFLTIIQWKFEWVYFAPMAPKLAWAQRPLFDMVDLLYKGQQFVNISRSTLSGILIFLIIVTLMRKRSAYIDSPIKIGPGLRSKIILIISLTGATAILFLPFNIRTENISQQSFDSMIGIDERPVTQTFVAEGREIRKILIDTKMEGVGQEKRYDVAVEIIDRKGDIILKDKIKTADLWGDKWIALPFKGLPVEKGERYTIKLYAAEAVKEPTFFLKFSSKDVYNKGDFTHEGKGITGDLAFRVVDQERMKISDEFLPRLLKDKTFIIIYSVVMAAILVVILK